MLFTVVLRAFPHAAAACMNKISSCVSPFPLGYEVMYMPNTIRSFSIIVVSSKSKHFFEGGHVKSSFVARMRILFGLCI